MLQQDAYRVISDLRQACATPAGYERSNRHPFAHLLNQLEYRFGDRKHGTFDHAKLEEVRQICDDWQRQRIGVDGGALGIHGIIERVEKFIPDLPTELPPSQVFMLPEDVHEGTRRALQAHAHAKLP